MLSDDRKMAIARQSGAWASEVSARAADWSGEPTRWVEFVRRIPAASVVDEPTVFYYDVVADTLQSGTLVEIPDSAGVVDWSAEHFSLLLKRVIRTVQVAAAPYEVQCAAYSNTPFVDVPTEVFEEFDESRRWVLQDGYLRGVLTGAQEAACLQVDAAFSAGIEFQATQFFTHEALRSSPRWQAVREAAGLLLRRLGIER